MTAECVDGGQGASPLRLLMVKCRLRYLLCQCIAQTSGENCPLAVLVSELDKRLLHTCLGSEWAVSFIHLAAIFPMGTFRGQGPDEYLRMAAVQISVCRGIWGILGSCAEYSAIDDRHYYT